MPYIPPIDVSPNCYLRILRPPVIESRIQPQPYPKIFKYVNGTASGVELFFGNVLGSAFPERENISFLDIGKVTEMVLGREGVERLNRFRMYEPGWNFGEGECLSGKSFVLMEYALNKFSLFETIPSIFMSNEGMLLLGWDDKSGNKVEIEFLEESISYYIESLDEENEIDITLSQIELLASKLQQI